MNLEDGILELIGDAGKTEYRGLICAGIDRKKIAHTLSGSETEKELLRLCVKLAGSENFSADEVSDFAKLAKAALRIRTNDGKSIKASVGLIFKKNAYSVAVDCLDRIEKMPEKVSASNVKDVLWLVGLIQNPELAGFLKSAIAQPEDKPDAFRQAALIHLLQKTPVLSVWKPGLLAQMVLNIILALTIVTVSTLLWWGDPMAILVAIAVYTASIIHFVYTSKKWVKQKLEMRENDPVLAYSNIEQILRNRQKGQYPRIEPLLEKFVSILEKMDKEGRRKLAQNFYSMFFIQYYERTTACLGDKFEGWKIRLKNLAE